MQAMLVSAAGHLQSQAPVVYSHANFVILDFKMKHMNKSKQKLLDAKTNDQHINLLKWPAIISLAFSPNTLQGTATSKRTLSVDPRMIRFHCGSTLSCNAPSYIPARFAFSNESRHQVWQG
jgi:hypothetical protein